MAFKQGNNPLSRKTSPMRTSPFRKEASVSMEDLKKMSAKQDAESKAQALKLPQIEKPGFDYEMDQDMSYPGGERGRDYDEEGTKDGMSRKDAAYFGLGKDDGKARKTKKADKTAKQVIKMQNKRSSVKNVYLGDPDDLQGEMVRTADKPAGKREKRKVKKLNKTKDQLGMSREYSPLNGLKPEKLVKEEPGAILKVNTPKVRKPRKSVGSVTTLKSEKKVDIKTDKKDIDSKILTKKNPDVKNTREKKDNSKAAIKLRKSKDKADPKTSKAQMRANKAKSKSEAAKEAAAENTPQNARNRAKAKRLAKKADRIEGREKRKGIRNQTKKDIKKTR